MRKEMPGSPAHVLYDLLQAAQMGAGFDAFAEETSKLRGRDIQAPVGGEYGGAVDPAEAGGGGDRFRYARLRAISRPFADFVLTGACAIRQQQRRSPLTH